MKKINTLTYWLLIFVMGFLNLNNAKAGSGDFGAWNQTSNGLNCGNMSFTEKELTLEFWIYIDDQDVAKNITGTSIISNRHDGSTGFTVSLNANTNNANSVDVRFWFKTVSGTAYALWIPRSEFSNKWNHVAFVISSKDKKATAYLNTVQYGNAIENFASDWIGNFKYDATLGANTTTNVGNLWLGTWYTSPKFYGKLADFRVWNKARSINDIKTDYKKVLTGTESGLQKYYTFDNEVFAQKPVKLTIENDSLKWTAEGEYWEVEVRSKTDNSVLKTETVINRSYSLAGLDPNSIVYVRTVNNGFYSGWAFKSDIIKVGCVGDSNTYGAEASDRTRYAWPAQIRTMLGSKYETQNFGVNGALMMNHLADAWKNKTAYSDNKAYDPDIIVIALGTNDSKDGYWDAVKFKNSYIDLINEFKSYSAEPKIYMAIPIKAYSSTWSINDQTIREQVIPTIKNISKEMGLPLIDLYAVTNNIANLMAADGIHPKDEGLGIMARKIADIMLAEKPTIKIVDQPDVANHAAYYWYKNNVLITDANAVNYTATETGSYKVAVKLTGATDDIIVSEPFELTQSNVTLSANCNYLTAVSSPTLNDINISSYNDQIKITNAASSTLSIYDIEGRSVAKFKLNKDVEYINSSFLRKGLYICQIYNGNISIASKILK